MVGAHPTGGGLQGVALLRRDGGQRSLQLGLADLQGCHAARRHAVEAGGVVQNRRVAEILADVQKRGDAAVLDYTQRFDRVSADSVAALEITQAELQAALKLKRDMLRPLIDAFAKAVA